MKRLLIAAIVLGVSSVILAQDAPKADPKHYQSVIDNASVRVLKVKYAAGEKSPMHSHPDAIAIAMSASKVTFTMPDGAKQDMDMPAESARYTPAGTHSPTATSAVDVVLVEFKGAAPGKATLPTQRPDMKMQVLAEGPRAMAYKSTADASFSEAAGTKHDYDQVVIALGPAQMSLSLDGKPAKTSWTRGEAAFIPRGTAHESKNTGGKPVDFIIVAVR